MSTSTPTDARALPSRHLTIRVPGALAARLERNAADRGRGGVKVPFASVVIAAMARGIDALEGNTDPPRPTPIHPEER